MKAHDFDVIARHAAPGISRRDSLVPLGGAALAALAVPAAAAAKRKGKHKNKNRNKRKKCKKKVQQTCRRQGDECRAYINAECPDQLCRDRFLTCCDSLATCSGTEALTCFFPPED